MFRHNKHLCKTINQIGGRIYFTLEQSSALTNTLGSSVFAMQATPHNPTLCQYCYHYAAGGVTLQNKMWCSLIYIQYMTISVCLQRWIKLRCKGHAGLQARPFRSNIQQDEEVAAPPRLSGSHGLFQDSSLQLSWSRHMGVAIYSLKHTKPHETHKNSDCKTEKCHHGFSRSSVGKSWIFTNLH